MRYHIHCLDLHGGDGYHPEEEIVDELDMNNQGINTNDIIKKLFCVSST